MSPAPALAQTARLIESHRVDQRYHRRYPIALEIEYKLFSKGRLERVGAGKTLNVSSGGVLFETEDALPAGSPVEILLTWPFLLEGVCPLKLVIQGRVVRSNNKLVAVRSNHHEFRTAGARATKMRSPSDEGGV